MPLGTVDWPLETDRVSLPIRGLADARDVAVSEDPEDSGEERLPAPVAFAVLNAEEADEGLGAGKAHKKGV